jgi:hypothetical protein
MASHVLWEIEIDAQYGSPRPETPQGTLQAVKPPRNGYDDSRG